jgi:hypothetical protein
MEWWTRFKHAAREIARRMPVSDFERVDGDLDKMLSAAPGEQPVKVSELTEAVIAFAAAHANGLIDIDERLMAFGCEMVAQAARVEMQRRVARHGAN